MNSIFNTKYNILNNTNTSNCQGCGPYINRNEFYSEQIKYMNTQTKLVNRTKRMLTSTHQLKEMLYRLSNRAVKRIVSINISKRGQPKNYRKRGQPEEEEKCPVCLELLTQEPIHPFHNCKHEIHRECLVDMNNSTKNCWDWDYLKIQEKFSCPLCRVVMHPTDVITTCNNITGILL